jgi:hypothetical protein
MDIYIGEPAKWLKPGYTMCIGRYRLVVGMFTL